jgi:hypothetical protein
MENPIAAQIHQLIETYGDARIIYGKLDEIMAMMVDHIAYSPVEEKQAASHYHLLRQIRNLFAS